MIPEMVFWWALAVIAVVVAVWVVLVTVFAVVALVVPRGKVSKVRGSEGPATVGGWLGNAKGRS